MDWINLKEQKPTEDNKYLVYYEDVFGKSIDICVWNSDIEQFVWDTDLEDIINDSVIAWMPLPEAVR